MNIVDKIKLFIGHIGCRLIRVGYPNALVILNTGWNYMREIPDLREIQQERERTG